MLRGTPRVLLINSLYMRYSRCSPCYSILPLPDPPFHVFPALFHIFLLLFHIPPVMPDPPSNYSRYSLSIVPHIPPLLFHIPLSLLFQIPPCYSTCFHHYSIFLPSTLPPHSLLLFQGFPPLIPVASHLFQVLSPLLVHGFPQLFIFLLLPAPTIKRQDPVLDPLGMLPSSPPWIQSLFPWDPSSLGCGP